MALFIQRLVFLLFVCCLKFALSFRSDFPKKKWPIRLAQGPSPNEGFLEVRENGRWKNLCDKYWGNRNSKVICRELGYTKYIAINMSDYALNSLDHIWFRHEFNCEGSESKLQDCGVTRIPSREYNRACLRNGPNPGVYVACSPEKENDVITPWIYIKENLPIRLHNSHVSHKHVSNTGFLEFRRDKKWYKVCADGWTEENSKVACGHLGYPDVEDENNRQRDVDMDSGATQYLLKDVTCSGFESYLWSCNMPQFEYSECVSKMPVYLHCKLPDENRIIEERVGEVRLRGGYRESEGRVEVYNGERWGTVCDDQWDIQDANVVCRQMGFGTAFEASHWADHGQGTEKPLMTNVQCEGTESDVRICTHSTNTSNCSNAEDAGVRCHYPHTRQPVRLVNRRKDNSNEGYIQVHVDGDWYGICGIDFSPKEGRVVCRQLGLGFVERAFKTYKYGVTYRKAMYNVKCEGNESSILDCKHNGWFRGRCRYYDMASVVCNKWAPDLVMDIGALQSSFKLNRHGLWQLMCSYEEGCLAPIVKEIRYKKGAKGKIRILMKFTSRVINKGTISFRPHIEKNDWIWHKCHEHYHSMETFADYDLIDASGTRISAGHKASFCLEDSECDSGFKKVFNCTAKGDQGISQNCADNYKNNIDCQWIDITEVPDGNYSLYIHINPTRDVVESDWKNNQAMCEIQLYNYTVTPTFCTADPCYVDTYGGNSHGSCCHFPFIYEDKKHYKCIEDDDGFRPWCATTKNMDIDSRWGFCNEKRTH